MDAGREYVESYVRFMHYVEAIYNAALQSVAGHHEHEAGPTKKEILDAVSHENMPGTVEGNPGIERSDLSSHVAIIIATLLIISVQLFLSKRKAVTN